MELLELPEAPVELRGGVKAWREPVVIPTYLPGAADKNPMFLEKRVYQGSSGRVYPLPYVDRISEEKTPREWDAVHIENEFVRLMILPALGGRIHVGLDKTNGYNFVYRQNVIKPALVGLAGPWISGGIEFNWPQHHRPSTFMPADVFIEHHADGAVTVWCGEHEPMNRMKGMHGVCLHPGKSLVEIKGRIFNRTPLMQTFLWWMNIATRVQERYQSFFPPDVGYVADHAKRAMSRFPLCDGLYYGVDYGKRGREGVAAEDAPRQFVPPGDYAANDLSWYANIPVPTSYMAMGSREDFFGGYDHGQQAGLVHVANYHISPGKKQWTWGNHEFGYAWDRNLTDNDGPYIELMAGVYTDNQPDFSFLHPGETRTFSQFLYPIQKIGPAQKANVEAAMSLVVGGSGARIGVAVTGELKGARILLDRGGTNVLDLRSDLAPGKPVLEDVALDGAFDAHELRLRIVAEDGREVVEYVPVKPAALEVPPPATEPRLPAEIASNDELYLSGLHLEQYRHATRAPEAYWREALRRDPGDARCNNAMGLWHLKRGEFAGAVKFFSAAIARNARRNPNPYDGEAYYNLGLALRFLGITEEAYAAFYKATWNYTWQSPAFYALAEMNCAAGRWTTALEHLERALRVNSEHLQARDLKAVVLRKLGRSVDADEILKRTLALNPLDFSAIYLSGETLKCDTQIRLDLALNFRRAGLYREGIELLRGALPEAGSGTAPLVFYYLADLLDRVEDVDGAKAARVSGKSALPDYCFPARLEEIGVLQAAIEADANDGRARYYLGNLFYDRRRHREAIGLWEESSQIDPGFAVVWRNLGIGYVNVSKNNAAAADAYDRARAADPGDARLLFERDQLRKQMGELPARRLGELEKHRELVGQRDDLSVQLCALYNQTGKPRRALEILNSRRFQPWEGGEGLALGQHVRAHLALGRTALKNDDWLAARRHFESALSAPENLGEAKHLLANQSDIHYWLGAAMDAAGDSAGAARHWEIAARSSGDFQEMSVRAFSEKTFYSAMAFKALGETDRARGLLNALLEYAKDLANTPAKIDYFATSLPDMLLFEEDLDRRRRIESKVLTAQAMLGLDDSTAAEAMLNDVLGEDPSHALAADLLNGEFQPCAS